MIRENNMDTTIEGLGCRVWVSGAVLVRCFDTSIPETNPLLTKKAMGNQDSL